MQLSFLFTFIVNVQLPFTYCSQWRFINQLCFINHFHQDFHATLSHFYELAGTKTFVNFACLVQWKRENINEMCENKGNIPLGEEFFKSTLGVGLSHFKIVEDLTCGNHAAEG